jgi:hypothetical protein
MRRALKTSILMTEFSPDSVSINLETQTPLTNAQKKYVRHGNSFVKQACVGLISAIFQSLFSSFGARNTSLACCTNILRPQLVLV